MAQSASPRPLLTIEEFFKLEESASMRHEYVGGVLYALAGASVRHNLLIGNIVAALRPSARERGCDVLTETVKLRIGDDVVYYPDIMVACNPDDTDPLYRTNPCLIIEVLSPTTSSIDRREKAMAYRRVPDLETYLIVYQDERHIERHWRSPDGAWQHAELHTKGIVPLPCPGIELTIDDLYGDVDL
jgi:Uma2 family endonuclease